MAERLFTLWAEGKIIFGEVIEGIDWRSYADLDCSGIWFVHGDKAEQFDFRAVVNAVTEDGVPVHGLTHRVGALEVGIEAFSNIDRRPTCYIRLSVKNVGDAPLSDRIGMLVRSGKEKQLVFGSPDEYASYAPDVDVW